MFSKPKNLRDLLKEDEIPGVDALLLRAGPLLSLLKNRKPLGINKVMKLIKILFLITVVMPGISLANIVNVAGDVESIQILEDGAAVIHFVKPHTNKNGCKHNQRVLLKGDHNNFSAIFDLAKLSLLYGHRISFGTKGCIDSQNTSYPLSISAKFRK